MSDKSKLNKGEEMKYNKLVCQSYFKAGNGLNSETKRRIVKVRLRDVAIKGNFKGKHSDIKCQVPGCEQDETQHHVFQSFCIYTSNVQRLNDNVQYDDIFKNIVSSQAFVADIIFENIIKRSKIIPAPHEMSEGPEEPRKKGGVKKKLSASPNLVIRKAREQKRNKGKQ